MAYFIEQDDDGNVRVWELSSDGKYVFDVKSPSVVKPVDQFIRGKINSCSEALNHDMIVKAQLFTAFAHPELEPLTFTFEDDMEIDEEEYLPAIVYH